MELWEDFSEWEARERTWGDVGRRGKAGGHWRKTRKDVSIHFLMLCSYRYDAITIFVSSPLFWTKGKLSKVSHRY